MTKPNIALLTGGFSAEVNISLLSAVKVHEWIDKSVYNVWLINISPDDWYYESENGTKISVDRGDFSLTTEKEKIHFQLAVFFPLQDDWPDILQEE